MQSQRTPAPVIIFVMDVSLLEPDASDWSVWIAQQRRETASRLRQKADRARCIGAGLLLAFALNRHDPTLPVPQNPELGWRGKPSLPNVPEFHFNISHSGKWVLCAVGDQPLGIDIELTNRDILNTAGGSLTLEERQHLERLDGQQRQEAATGIWALKESYAKALGLGLHLPFEELNLHFRLWATLRLRFQLAPATILYLAFHWMRRLGMR